MRCTIVLEFDNGDGSVVKRVEVMRLHRPIDDQTPGDVGLSLSEGSLCSIVCSRSSLSSRSNVFAPRIDPVWIAASSVVCMIIIARS